MARALKSPYKRHPLQRWPYQLAFALLLLALGAWAGFRFGQTAAYGDQGLDPATYRSMQEELPGLQQRFDDLQAELEVVQTRYAVDREALQMVRGEIAEQKEQIASLEEGIRFYRGLMSPEDIAQGLSVRTPELVARDPTGTYAFRIVALQGARKHELLKGELQAEVFGQLNGEAQSHPLAALSGDIENGAITLRFRYFQAIEGELALPEGFEPHGINVVASSSSPRKSEVRERFAWQVQERFTHVGK